MVRKLRRMLTRRLGDGSQSPVRAATEPYLPRGATIRAHISSARPAATGRFSNDTDLMVSPSICIRQSHRWISCARFNLCEVMPPLANRFSALATVTPATHLSERIDFRCGDLPTRNFGPSVRTADRVRIPGIAMGSPLSGQASLRERARQRLLSA